MGYNYFITDSNEDVITSDELGAIRPGKQNTAKKYGIKNLTESASTPDVAFWPGVKNGQFTNLIGNPLRSVRVVRVTAGGIEKKEDVTKEDVGAVLTLRDDRGKCFLWDNSANTYVDYSTGNVLFMDEALDYLYIGVDEIVRNIAFEFAAPGSYAGVAFKYSSVEDGSAFTALPIDAVDGTLGLTGDGVLFLGALTPTLWKKTTINGYRMFWIRVECSTRTTRAESDVLHWTWVYNYPHHFLLGSADIYTKSDDTTPVYTDITGDIVYDYPNLGWVVFDNNPIAANPTYSIVGEYSYKLPQSGEYTLDFPTDSTCQVNGGVVKGIIADGKYIHTNIIDGLELVFTDNVQELNQAFIEISDALKYTWYAPDLDDSPGTYQNSDLTLASIASGEVGYFWLKQAPHVSVDTDDNTREVEAFAYEL